MDTTICTRNPFAAESVRQAAVLAEASRNMWSQLDNLDLTETQRRAVVDWYESAALAPALTVLWQHVQEEGLDDYGCCCEPSTA